MAEQTLEQSVLAYVAAWNTTDSTARRELLERSFAADGTYTDPAASVVGRVALAATDQPPVLSRDQWGADPQYMTWAPQFYPTKKLIVHHTATSNDYADRAGAESQVRSIYYYHSVTQGWGDIGYNFLIDKFGNVYEGRYSREYGGANPSGDDANANGVTGARTSGWNSGTVGVAMLGTFTDRDVTPAARDALEALLAWEANRHGIDPQATQPFVNPVSGATTTTPNIAAHRDYTATECPGDTFYGTLPAIRSQVAARIAGPGTADTTAPTPPSNLTASGGKSRVTLSWAKSSDDVGVAGYRVLRSRSSSGTFTQVAFCRWHVVPSTARLRGGRRTTTRSRHTMLPATSARPATPPLRAPPDGAPPQVPEDRVTFRQA
ncbi:MAG: N-acetylmuramoyl-L-alanine amidase [Nocardioidaceae bacterium]